MAFTQAIFRRAELLLGDEVMSSIGQKRVIIFGVDIVPLSPLYN